MQARKFTSLTLEHLKQMGAAVNRARYFVALNTPNPYLKELTSENFRQMLLGQTATKFGEERTGQLSFF